MKYKKLQTFVINVFLEEAQFCLSNEGNFLVDFRVNLSTLV